MAVSEVKTRVLGEFCEAMENDFRLAPQRFWQTDLSITGAEITEVVKKLHRGPWG